MKTRLIGILTLVAFVCAALSLASCKPKKTTVPNVNKPTPAPTKTEVEPNKTEVKPVQPTAITPEPNDSVLVTVNGVDITQKQLDDLIKPHLERMTKQAANLPPAFLEQQKKLLRSQALQEMIGMQLLNEKVKLANITISDQEITDEIKRVAAMRKPPVTVEEFKKKMQEYGIDIEQMNSQIRTMLAQQKLMAKEFPDDVNFTEEDAKAYYEKNKAGYETPEQVRASHILIKPAPTDPNSDPNEAKAVAKAKAEDLLKQIKEGADFAALAKTNSSCPSAQKGGDLDFFGKGQMVPEFDKAAFELEIGKVSEVVETQFGFHIIKLTDKKEATTTSFEEAKDAIMAEQAQRKLRDLAVQYVEKLKTGAKIDYAPGMEPTSAPPRRAPGVQPIQPKRQPVPAAPGTKPEQPAPATPEAQHKEPAPATPAEQPPSSPSNPAPATPDTQPKEPAPAAPAEQPKQPAPAAPAGAGDKT